METPGGKRPGYLHHLESIDGEPLPLVLVCHGPLQIATFLGVAIAIYFHFGVRLNTITTGNFNASFQDRIAATAN